MLDDPRHDAGRRRHRAAELAQGGHRRARIGCWTSPRLPLDRRRGRRARAADRGAGADERRRRAPGGRRPATRCSPSRCCSRRRRSCATWRRWAATSCSAPAARTSAPTPRCRATSVGPARAARRWTGDTSGHAIFGWTAAVRGHPSVRPRRRAHRAGRRRWSCAARPAERARCRSRSFILLPTEDERHRHTALEPGELIIAITGASGVAALALPEGPGAGVVRVRGGVGGRGARAGRPGDRSRRGSRWARSRTGRGGCRRPRPRCAGTDVADTAAVRAAVDVAFADARPLPGNAFKVELARRAARPRAADGRRGAMTVLGQALPRPDGPAKLTGAARLLGRPGRHRAPPDLLHATLVTATVPGGRIAELDVAQARAAPGVAAVLTAADMPKLAPSGPAAGDHDAADAGRRRALRGPADRAGGGGVAASRPSTRRGWCGVRYDDVAAPVAFGDAPVVTPAGAYNLGPPDVDQGRRRGRPRGGRRGRAGDVRHRRPAPQPDRALVNARLVGRRPSSPCRTRCRGSSRVRAVLAEAFGIPADHVHVSCPFVGGGFGCKGFVHPHQLLAAAAARWLGRPVRVDAHPRPDVHRLRAPARHPAGDHAGRHPHRAS